MLSEQKLKAVKMAYDGYMGASIAEKLDVSGGTLCNWGILVKDIRAKKKSGMTLQGVIDEIDAATTPKTNGHANGHDNGGGHMYTLKDINDKLDKILEFISKF